MELNSLKNSQEYKYTQALKRVREIKSFYIHLFIYLAVNIFLIFIKSEWNINNGHSIHFSGYGTALFWGIGLFCHWASVFGLNLFLSKKWEERKVNEILERDKQSRQKWE